MKKRVRLIISIVISLFICIMGFYFLNPNSTVLIIDDVKVSKFELEFFMQKERAVTVAYFQNKYGFEFDNKFWNTKIDGITPIEYLRTIAVDNLKNAKTIQILGLKNNIVQDISFNSLIKEFDLENKKRLSNNDIIYGISILDFYQYYDYYLSNLSLDVKNHIIQNDITMSEAELLAFYETVKDNYKNLDNSSTQKYKSFDEVKTTITNLYVDKIYKNMVLDLSTKSEVKKIVPLFYFINIK